MRRSKVQAYMEALGLPLSSPHVHIGIDVGATFSVVYVHEERRTFKVEHKDLPEAFAKLPRPARAYIEQTGRYSYPVIRALLAHGIEVYLVEGRRIKGMRVARASRAKTDKIDAKILAHYGILHEQTPEDFPASPVDIEQYEMRNVVHEYYRLDKDITQRVNRLKGFLAAIAPELYKSKAWTINHLDEIEAEIEKNPSFFTSIKEAIFREIRILRELLNHREALKERMLEVARRHPDYELLLSLPGVGPVIAASLISVYWDISRFSSRKSFISFMGFAKDPFQSGTSVKRQKRYASSWVARKVIYLLYWQVLRLKEKSPWWPYIEPHLSKKQPKRKVFHKFADKFLRVFYGMLIRRKPFSPEKLSEPGGVVGPAQKPEPEENVRPRARGKIIQKSQQNPTQGREISPEFSEDNPQTLEPSPTQARQNNPEFSGKIGEKPPQFPPYERTPAESAFRSRGHRPHRGPGKPPGALGEPEPGFSGNSRSPRGKT